MDNGWPWFKTSSGVFAPRGVNGFTWNVFPFKEGFPLLLNFGISTRDYGIFRFLLQWIHFNVKSTRGTTGKHFTQACFDWCFFPKKSIHSSMPFALKFPWCLEIIRKPMLFHLIIFEGELGKPLLFLRSCISMDISHVISCWWLHTSSLLSQPPCHTSTHHERP